MNLDRRPKKKSEGTLAPKSNEKDFCRRRCQVEKKERRVGRKDNLIEKTICQNWAKINPTFQLQVIKQTNFFSRSQSIAPFSIIT